MTTAQIQTVVTALYGQNVMNQWVRPDERLARITLKWDGNYFFRHKGMRIMFDTNLECIKACMGEEITREDGTIVFIPYNHSKAPALKADSYVSFEILSGFTFASPENARPYESGVPELQELRKDYFKKDLFEGVTK